jgi:DNA-binding IclR family transcriptional regulator
MIAQLTQSVPALERALTILEMLANSRTGLTLPDIVRQSGLPKSSVHCLLLTLQRRGYLHRNEKTSRYMFGLKLFSLANTAISGLKLREEAAPFLRSLVEKTGLTVHMAILEQDEAVLISKVEPQEISRLATWLGKRMDVHCTGLGKALIAQLPEEELSRLIKAHGLPRHNENTVASIRKLRENLAQVVRLGYSIDDEEDEIGLRCIGAPVFNHEAVAIAAVSIAGTIEQVTANNLSVLAENVKQTAASISRVLGYCPGGAV